METVQLVVVGGGPAGMAAALEAERQGLTQIVLLERNDRLGGILNQCIHTGFGLQYFNEELTGPEYAARFASQVEQSPCIKVVLGCTVQHLEPSTQGHVVHGVSEQGVHDFLATAVVLATGCRERPRGSIAMAGSRPAGIMTAGQAQYYVNIEGYLPGREVVILGSGDIGLIMARRLTLEGAHVRLVCELLPYSSGLERNRVQCLEDFAIPLRLSTTVVQVHGKHRLKAVTLAQVDEHRQAIAGTEEYVPCDLLLLAVGLIPENELARAAQIPLDAATGGALVNAERQTEQPGVFACGNALHVHDMVDYVTLESQAAGAGAARYVQGKPQQANAEVAIMAGKGVRYVVPARTQTKTDAPLALYFRVTNVHRNAKVCVRCGEKTLWEQSRARLSPGEMETIVLEPATLAAVQLGVGVQVEVWS